MLYRRYSGTVGETDGGELAEPIRPHLLACRQCDKRLGRAAIFLPIFLVLRPYGVGQRKARVPITRAFGVFDSREIRHERPIRPRRLERDYCAKSKNIRMLGKLRTRFGIEIRKRNAVAGNGLEIIS